MTFLVPLRGRQDSFSPTLFGLTGNIQVQKCYLCITHPSGTEFESRQAWSRLWKNSRCSRGRILNTLFCSISKYFGERCTQNSQATQNSLHPSWKPSNRLSMCTLEKSETSDVLPPSWVISVVTYWVPLVCKDSAFNTVRHWCLYFGKVAKGSAYMSLPLFPLIYVLCRYYPNAGW